MSEPPHIPLKAYSGRALLIAAGASSALHLTLALSVPRWGGGGGIPMLRRPPTIVRVEVFRELARALPSPRPEPSGVRKAAARGAGSADSRVSSAGRVRMGRPGPVGSAAPAPSIPTLPEGEFAAASMAEGDGSGVAGRGAGAVAALQEGGAIAEAEGDGESALEMWELEEPPRQVGFASPAYPEVARRLGVEGSVLVRYLLGPDGRVEQAMAVAGPELLREASMKAVLRFVYEPVRQGGRARKVWMRQVITFRLE